MTSPETEAVKEMLETQKEAARELLQKVLDNLGDHRVYTMSTLISCLESATSHLNQIRTLVGVLDRMELARHAHENAQRGTGY